MTDSVCQMFQSCARHFSLFTRILSTCLLQSKLETCIYIIGRLHKESLWQIVGMESGLSEDKSVGCTKCQPVTSCNGFISFFYWSGVTISIMESTYKKCLGEEWGKFTGCQLLSSFWLKVARTDEDENTPRWDRETLPIRNLYPKWEMLRFGRIRKVTNWILILWFIVSY